jgi:hypothetical protein
LQNPWATVQGEFNQHGFVVSNCGGPQGSSTWAGLGGRFARPDGSIGLLQAGTTTTTFAGDAPVIAFWEYIGRNAAGMNIGVPSMAFNPNLEVLGNDDVYTLTTYNPGNGVAEFEVIDRTRGTNAVQFVGNMQAYWEGNSGDFIDERPSMVTGPGLASTPVNLREWGQHRSTWTNGLVTNLPAAGGATTTVGANNHELIQMTGNGGIDHVLATIYDDLATNSTWTDNWQGCN